MLSITFYRNILTFGTQGWQIVMFNSSFCRNFPLRKPIYIYLCINFIKGFSGSADLWGFDVYFFFFFLLLFFLPVVGIESFLKLHIVFNTLWPSKYTRASPQGLSPLLWAGGGQVRETCAELHHIGSEGSAPAEVERSVVPRPFRLVCWSSCMSCLALWETTAYQFDYWSVG